MPEPSVDMGMLIVSPPPPPPFERVAHVVVAAGFLSRYLNALNTSLNKTFPSLWVHLDLQKGTFFD